MNSYMAGGNIIAPPSRQLGGSGNSSNDISGFNSSDGSMNVTGGGMNKTIIEIPGVMKNHVMLHIYGESFLPWLKNSPSAGTRISAGKLGDEERSDVLCN